MHLVGLPEPVEVAWRTLGISICDSVRGRERKGPGSSSLDWEESLQAEL